MSSKKSDSPASSAAICGIRPWSVTLLSNVWIPVALVAITVVGRHYEYADWPGAYVMNIVMRIGINIILAVSLQLINGISGQFSLGHAGFMAIGAYLAGYATKTFAGLPSGNDDPNPNFYNPVAVLLFFLALMLALAIGALVIYGIFALIRRTRRLNSSLASTLLFAILVWFATDIAYGLEPGASTTYLVFTRLISADKRLYDFLLDHGLPLALRLSSLLPFMLLKPSTLLVAMIGGGILAAAAGLIVGLPTLRLRGDYLAIATLGFGEIIRVAIVNCTALGGATGLQLSTYWT